MTAMVFLAQAYYFTKFALTFLHTRTGISYAVFNFGLQWFDGRGLVGINLYL